MLFSRKRGLAYLYFLHENDSLQHRLLHDLRQMTTFIVLEVRYFQRVRFLGSPFFQVQGRCRVFRWYRQKVITLLVIKLLSGREMYSPEQSQSCQSHSQTGSRKTDQSKEVPSSFVKWRQFDITLCLFTILYLFSYCLFNSSCILLNISSWIIFSSCFVLASSFFFTLEIELFKLSATSSKRAIFSSIILDHSSRFTISLSSNKISWY